MIVVDSNVVAYCWILGDKSEVAQRVRVRDPEWHVPYLWRSELRNALAGYLWRGSIDVARAAATMAAAERALAGCEHMVSSDTVLELTVGSRLSAYDCEFVALARSLAVPLVTEDAAVLKAFPELALSMEGFVTKFAEAPPTAHEKRTRYGASAGRFARRRPVGAK